MKNIGKIDKTIRYIIAIISVIVGYTIANSPWNYVLYGIAVFAIITALVSTCPTWLILGVNTLKKNKK